MIERGGNGCLAGDMMVAMYADRGAECTTSIRFSNTKILAGGQYKAPCGGTLYQPLFPSRRAPPSSAQALSPRPRGCCRAPAAGPAVERTGTESSTAGLLSRPAVERTGTEPSTAGLLSRPAVERTGTEFSTAGPLPPSRRGPAVERTGTVPSTARLLSRPAVECDSGAGVCRDPRCTLRLPERKHVGVERKLSGNYLRRGRKMGGPSRWRLRKLRVARH